MQDIFVDEMEGVEVTGTGTDVDGPPLLSEQESRILEFYDRLEELQLEIALLKARGIISQGMQSYMGFTVTILTSYLQTSP